ncbi:MAG: hypothetical protein LBK47_03245 [Prevotellaceae bacterium]|nr:hypothetical protein [Prevotellaceae bacterium]
MTIYNLPVRVRCHAEPVEPKVDEANGASGKADSSALLRGACPERSRGGRNDEAEVPPLRYAPVGMTRRREKRGFRATKPP